MNANGTALANLTNNPYSDEAPAWSPNGTKIAFKSNRDLYNDEIYSMNANGSGQINLTGSPAGEGDPSWAALWPPSNTDLPVISGTPHEGQQLSCSEGTWDDDPTGFAYQWQRDGSSISGATDATYTLDGADAGRAITCRVTATNAAGSGSATSDAVDAIGVPSNTAAPEISGTPHVGQTLSCSQGTWENDPDPTGFAHQWLRDGSSISGATDATYTLDGADAGSAITCRVTATNAAGSDSATSDAVDAIGVPSNTAAPEISGTPHVGQTLSCSQGTWENDPDPTGFAYQWLRDGSSISGATDATYTLDGADAGSAITCRVTATNAAGSDSATSDAVDAIGVPSNTAAPEISGTPHVGQTLSCSQGTWQNDPTGFAYQWLRDGSSISGATDATYTLDEDDADSSITCRVVVSNAAGNSSATSDAVAAIGVPSNSTRPAISGTPQVGQTLTCSQGTWHNNPIGFSYQWLRGGSAIDGATGSTYKLVEADGGRAIKCRVTATNDAGSDSSTSAELRVPTRTSPATRRRRAGDNYRLRPRGGGQGDERDLRLPCKRDGGRI